LSRRDGPTNLLWERASIFRPTDDATTRDYRSYSFWLDSLDETIDPRSELGTDVQLDVAIVGAGYTGLWTAYYLKKSDPSLRIAILEKEIAGFGASGRNGGWCSAWFAASWEKIARRSGRDAANRMQEEMFATVDEVGRACEAEDLDCHFRKGGALTLASIPAQAVRLRESVKEAHDWGFGESDYRWLDRNEARKRIAAASCHGAVYSPHCAAIHPARLVRGLATVVERMGVSIYERTPVTGIAAGRVTTPRGTVTSDVIVRATEAYTALLSGERRRLLPLYSLMIATEPLPGAFWDEVGWKENETMTDGRHLVIYAQRTPDDRIAIGGRGAPYHFGSRISDGFDREPRVFEGLARALHSLFPASAGTRITHTWGGCLGVPRDWYSSVGFDRSSRVAWAGGYVGDGVATANLAGRTLTDLILERDTDITRLPWVGHRSRRWEPEPLRWLGVNLALRAMESADSAEVRTGHPARRAKLVGRLVGL
jgi:glycine/D-amino acid oxidase-like deaminating enzyme